MVLIGLTYKILPDATVRWRDAWVGAAVTAALFTVGNSAIRAYLSAASVRSLYGAAGTLILFILWVYVSAQIFFFGAEFTHVYARKHGAPIVPKGKAVRFSREIHLD
jgi:membrane protein